MDGKSDSSTGSESILEHIRELYDCDVRSEAVTTSDMSEWEWGVLRTQQPSVAAAAFYVASSVAVTKKSFITLRPTPPHPRP